MNYKYIKSNEVTDLIEKYFCLSFNENDLPFKSIILTLGLTHLFYIETGTQKSYYQW